MMAAANAAPLLDARALRRYEDALRRLSWGEVSVPALVRRANLHAHERAVRALLAADPRYEKVQRPGPERYLLRAEHRHVARLRRTIPTEANT